MFRYLKNCILRHKVHTARFKQWQRWQRGLSLRSDEQFHQLWATENLSSIQAQAIKDIPRIMGLSSAKLFPSDDIFLILYNPHADFRNVEAMQYIDKNLHINFPDIYEKYHLQGLNLVDFLKK